MLSVLSSSPRVARKWRRAFQEARRSSSSAFLPRAVVAQLLAGLFCERHKSTHDVRMLRCQSCGFAKVGLEIIQLRVLDHAIGAVGWPMAQVKLPLSGAYGLEVAHEVVEEAIVRSPGAGLC
jgi:hypothetical protein